MLDSMDRIVDFQHVFAQMVVARAGSEAPEILAAFSRVPRHVFLGPGPWQVSERGGRTPSDDPALVYQDVGMGLSGSITTGLPSLHARNLDACRPRPGERVVQVGAGSGYFTAILAELVGDAGRVVAYEVEADLATRAQAEEGGMVTRGANRMFGGSKALQDAKEKFLRERRINLLPLPTRR